MKISFLLMFAVLFNVMAISVNGQNESFKIKMKNVVVRDLLKEVESKTSYRFFFSDNYADIYKTISIDVETNDIAELLAEVFKKSTVTYKILDNYAVVITPVKTLQGISITGTVTDHTGQPIPGVNVLIKGTLTGEVTDINGKYRITVPNKDAVLVFSFVGFKTSEILVGDQVAIDMILEESLHELEEVVVVSYGSQSRRKITGAVQSINTEELADIPVSQITQKFQGKFAGVQINQTTGIPGQGMSIRIRGQASISAGSDPLYVVDGFPITSDIANINPDEIESISILKDASSTSLYGSRAANGVVIVTTKRAKYGTSNVNISAYAGWQHIPQAGRPDLMNAREFAKFKKEIAEENGWAVDPMFQNPDQYGEGTNWLDAVTRVAPIQNYSISYSTTKDKFSTSAVAGYFGQEGILLNSNYNRFSLRINSDYKFNEKVRIGLNMAGTHTSRKTPQSDGLWYDSPSIVQSALVTSPLAPYKNDDGTIPLSVSGYGTLDAPNWYNQVQVVKNTGKSANVISNAFIEIETLPNLVFKSSANVDLGNTVSDFFNPSTAGSIFNAPNEADASRIYATHGNTYGYSWLWENTLTYKFDLGNHGFDLLGGYTSQKAHSETGSFRGEGFPDNRVQTLNAAKTITGSTDIQDWTLLSVVARLNYHYKNKYLLSVAYRRDGSSRFGTDNRWGDFPSVSVGWVVSDENFMNSLNFISFLKLRASYGIIGNNNVGNYTQYSNIVDTNNPFNNVIMSGKSIAGLNNSMLGWEDTKELDLGLDINVLDNRINFSYDYYHKLTDNLLYSVEIPISSGFYNFMTNIGELEFWGHEFTLGTKNLTGEFKWNTDFNISFNENKAKKLGTTNAAVYGDNVITKVGERIGQLYTLVWEGVYKNQEDYDNSPKYVGAQVGTVKFKDVSGDGEVTNDDRDKAMVGRTAPKGVYGITNTFYYKNFDLSIVASGAYGHKIINAQERFTTNLDGSFNVLKALDRRWRSESDPGDGVYGKVISGTTSYERDWASSKFVYNASYFTIKNITLGYQIPLKSNPYIKGLRVYGSIQQAWVFTGYPGNNPEVSSAGGLYTGTDYTTYPVPRTFTFGINMNL